MSSFPPAAPQRGAGQPVPAPDLHLNGSRLGSISRRRILYWLTVMVAVLVVGSIVGFIWADTSNLAGSFAVATNIIGSGGIVVLLIAVEVGRRRQRRAA